MVTGVPVEVLAGFVGTCVVMRTSRFCVLFEWSMLWVIPLPSILEMIQSF